MTRSLCILPFAVLAIACQPAAPETAQESPQAPDTAVASPAVPVSPAPSAGIDEAPAAPSAQDLADAQDQCGAAKVQRYIGQESTVPVRVAVARESGAASDRWIYPDSVVTEDFSPTRLNVVLEKGTDRIVSMRCG